MINTLLRIAGVVANTYFVFWAGHEIIPEHYQWWLTPSWIMLVAWWFVILFALFEKHITP